MDNDLECEWLDISTGFARGIDSVTSVDTHGRELVGGSGGGCRCGWNAGLGQLEPDKELLTGSDFFNNRCGNQTAVGRKLIHLVLFLNDSSVDVVAKYIVLHEPRTIAGDKDRERKKE